MAKSKNDKRPSTDPKKKLPEPSRYMRNVPDPYGTAPDHSISRRMKELLAKHPVDEKIVKEVKEMYPEMGELWRPSWAVLVAWATIKDAYDGEPRLRSTARNQLLRYVDGLPKQVHEHQGHILTTFTDIIAAAEAEEAEKNLESDEQQESEGQEDEQTR